MKEKKSNIFYILIIIIIFLSAFARFYYVDKRPLYFDEGTHWYTFINKIYMGEKIQYYPDFHGFTSWYLSAIPLFFLGSTVFAIRFMVALIGLLTIILIFLLKDKLGKFGIFLTALFMSISPTFVFYSRQVSQYPYIIFFTLLSLIFIILYLERNKSFYLYLFSATLAFLISTHEIATIYIAILLSFIFFIYYFNPDGRKLILKQIKKHKEENFKTLIFSLILFLLILILIMSSFFTNFKTFGEFLKQFSFQFDKSYDTGHNKNMFYYIKTFLILEIFAFLGTFLSLFFLKRNILSLFLFFWTFFSLIIFSIIPYKVPWMFMIVLLPMYLLSGLIFGNIIEKLKDKKIIKAIFYLILTGLFILTSYNSVKLNFIYPTGDLKTNPLNYAGPTDDNYRLINDLKILIPNKSAKILFVGDKLWPLQYYLRDYKNSFVEENASLEEYYQNYDIFIITKNKYYDNKTFYKLGEYELRQNYYIKILAKIS